MTLCVWLADAVVTMTGGVQLTRMTRATQSLVARYDYISTDKVVSSDEDVKKVVSANKGAIGYVKASSVDESVKVAIR